MDRELRYQRGAALLILATVFVMGSTLLILLRLNAQPSFVPAQRDHNARVLNQAKQALVGWVATTAAKSGEDNPGRLPCPEANGDVGVGASEGTASGNCTLPAVGRLPWRTLGLDKLVDAAGEPLWYVVSPGWAYTSSDLTINSNTRGNLNVDGQANSAIALIIAPGRAMNVAASAGCTARNQARSAPVPGINAADYLECYSTGGAAFSTIGPASSFNDQVVPVTTRDVLPALEAAIMKRIEREIVPVLKTVYASATWGTNVSATNPIYPFAAPFSDPGLTSSFQGSAASCASNVCQGLLPVVFNNQPGSSTVCTPSAGSPCDPTFVRWTAGTVQRTAGLTITPNPSTCSVAVVAGTTHATRLDCVMRVWSLLGGNGTVNFRVEATASNVGMAMRQFDPAVTLSNATLTSVPSVAMNADGSATVTLNGRATVGPDPGGLGSVVSNLLCGIGGLLGLVFNCREVAISVPFTMFPDHALLDTTDPTTGWFMRNEWYRVLYYAAAQGATASVLPAAANCTPGTNCLTLDLDNDKRALVFLAGRSLTGTVGHNRALADFFDSAANRDGNAAFETKTVGSSFNDRAIVVQTD